MILKRIGPASAAKISGLLYAIIGLIAGALFSFFSIVASAFGDGGSMGFLFGIGSIIILPIFYGLLGAIGGLVGAWLYNVLVGFVGGIEVEFEDDQINQSLPNLNQQM